ncbi:SusC/RagA family TonB-linked outer membrane protein [Viscerimonas tarda]
MKNYPYKKRKKRVMRLLYLAILFFGIHAGAFAQSGKITMNVKDVPIRQFFDKIEEQSEYRFTYRDKSIDDERHITYSASDEVIESLLQKVLTPLGLQFQISKNDILIVRKTAEQKEVRNKTFAGIVTDATGETIIGANVAVKGTNIGTTTDVDGQFSLNVPVGSSLLVSYLGYVSKVVKVGENSNIQITLQEDTQLLEEVVVVGYGTQSQKMVTTSISKLKMADVDQGNDFNPVKMLQGRVTGVNISSSSGTPGAEPNVIVRGVGSISGSSAPLYVVDGIPSEKYPRLNPNDIESMEVLKDASAAAIYGSRANTGVIIITTKAGKSGKTQIDFSARTGFGVISSDITMANSSEYANAMQVALDNYNVQMKTNLKFYTPSNIENTNWVNLISRDIAHSQAASVSISGGSDKTTFYASYGYDNQQGYLIKSNYTQNTLRAKFGHKINDMFKLNMNISGAISKQDVLEEESTSLKVLRTAREEQPWYSPYLEDGTSYKVNGTMILRHNPLMLINEEDWVQRKNQLSGVFSLDITPFKGFKYTPSVSIYGIFDNESKKLSDRHDARKNNDGWSALSQQKDVSVRYVIDNIFSYTYDWNKLMASAMLGHSFEHYEYEQFGARSENYANGAYPSSSFNVINAGANIYAGSINYTGYALESYFGRLALNWDNRYIFNTTMRRDGSSRFFKKTRYGNFPSASFAWRISNEDFYNLNDYINDWKFRVSWGMTGSMAGVGNFAALSLVGSGGNSYNGAAGFQISQDAQNLKWEKSNQYNIGTDVELLNSRIVLNIDAFYQKTSDLLYNKPVYATTGNTVIQSNIGTIENKGLEFGINGKILTGDFKWDLGGNISYVKNKLLSLIDGVDQYIVPSSGSNLLGGAMHILKNGEPVSSYYMLKMNGIYQYDEDVPAKLYAKGVRAGDVMYDDFNKDGDISDADRQIIGKATPDFVGGITSTMNYKGFDFSIFSQYSIGGKIVSAWKGINGVEGTDHLGLAYASVKVPDKSESVEQFFNVSKEVATHYWQGPGSSNTVPRPVRLGVHTGYSYDYNVLTSTRYLEDASYFKIKTVTLGYTLPDNWLEKAKIASLRVYVSADNLFSFTKYSGYDPESSYTGTPGAANYGVDFGLQPSLRTFVAGVSLKF